MMMRFSAVANDMREAVFRFCMEQCSVNSSVSVDEIKKLVTTAFDVFNKVSYAGIGTTPFYSYHMYAGEQYTNEIFPENIKQNGVITERGVLLGTFIVDGYSADTTDKVIMRGYDVVYDPDERTVKLLYRIMISDEDATTVYRVETELYEEFDVYSFILDMTAQMSGRLVQGAFIPAPETVCNCIPTISIMEVC